MEELVEIPSLTATMSLVKELEKPNTEANFMRKAIREERNSIPYFSASSCNPIGAVVPTKISYESIAALSYFLENKIDTAEFVREKCGYNSRVAVADAFSAEQCDALALAILQVEKGNGFILGDMAGLGKGRICAGMQRYAYFQKKIPVFITIQPNLFSDIYRDLRDINGISNDKLFPVPFILNSANGSEDPSIYLDKKILFSARSTAEIKADCLTKELPVGYDNVLLTYSQLSGDITTDQGINTKIKYDFLSAIAPRAIFIIDESHKGAGDGNTGMNMTGQISLASGAMFSSATYAKVPKSMMMYIPKTDIKDSNIRPDTIVKSVEANGEVVQEYIAGLLVKSGQMVRRERTFAGCRIDYEYMKLADKLKYYALYDNVMQLYNEVEAFAKSELFLTAQRNAIKRIAKLHKVDLMDPQDKKPANKESIEYEEWYQRNRFNYIPSYNSTRLLRNRFQWIENLLFSIKADFVAEKVIDLLRAQEEVHYDEAGKKFTKKTNYKPVIAVRNTAETALKSLGYKPSDVISKEDNDYGRTLIHVINSLASGTLTFKPVNVDKKKIIVENAMIIPEDYSDAAQRFNELVEKMEMAFAGLPLSPIDHMIDKISNAQREAWDYGYTTNPNYVVEEVTKRSIAVRKDKDTGAFKIVPLPGESSNKKFERFNSGQSDVIILNTAGSTGSSIHSSITFVDRRPRFQLIHQVELDVNTEIQKRGRVNRTGQVNKPGYGYMVSVIPSEIRKLMMFRKKLRSLDANATGNLKQSAKASEIKDPNGNEIEDIYNKYGFSVLLNFLDTPEGEKFKGLGGRDWADDEKWYPEDMLDAFARELEKSPCVEQEEFYNAINIAYVDYKNMLIEQDEYDLETSVEDLQASTLNKKVLYKGVDTNEFTKSVYIEDKYVTPKGVPYTLEELNEKMNELCGGTDHKKYHNDLLDEFIKYTEDKAKQIVEYFGNPDYSNAHTEEQKAAVKQAHDKKVFDTLMAATGKFDKIKKALIHFYIGKPICLPLDFELLRNGAFDEEGKLLQFPYVLGKFVGYRILSHSGNKFTGMNIELNFASVSKIKPQAKFTLTNQYKGVLDWMMTRQPHPDVELPKISAWIIKKQQERDKMRVLTGEIFKGFDIANGMIANNKNYMARKKLIKYSTLLGTIETGIRMYQETYFPITEGIPPLYVAINDARFYEKVKETPKSKQNWLPSFTEYFNGGDESGANKVFFNISTGKKEGNKHPTDRFASIYSLPTQLQELVDVVGEQPYEEMKDIIIPVNGNSDKYKILFLVFALNEEQYKKLVDYLYHQKIFVEIVDVESDFIVRDLPDTLIEQATQEENGRGEYAYRIQSGFDEEQLPPDFISYDKQKGIVITAFQLQPVYARAYKLVPLQINAGKAVRSILALLGDDVQKKEFIDQVLSMGDNYVDVGEFTEKTIKMPVKYAVGNMDIYYAGKVISEYLHSPETGGADEIPDEESALPEVEREVIHLNWDSAQDYLIKMKSF